MCQVSEEEAAVLSTAVLPPTTEADPCFQEGKWPPTLGLSKCFVLQNGTTVEIILKDYSRHLHSATVIYFYTL